MNYTVIGAARSGMAASILAKKLGHNVFVTESQDEEDFSEAKVLFEKFDIDFEFGGNTEKSLRHAEYIITSPGVPRKAWVIQEAEKRNIPIISELEFARQHCKDNPLIAITGTNGKTTTTTLIAYILNKSGKKAVAVGNIGTPLSSVVGNIEKDTIIVAEVSSYQLDKIVDFRPDVAIIMNITPDHLAYHQTLDNYIEAKFKIFANQSEKDLLILNGDDAIVAKGAETTRGQVAFFSQSPVSKGIYAKDGKLVARLSEQHKEEEIMLLSEIRLPGVHNAYNSMAAALAARAFEVRNENIRDCLMKFEGVEHRLEFVRSIDGVDYINDSKATNINATWYALSSYTRPIVWIAGGRGDSNDYSLLDEYVEKNVKCIVAIGEEADAIFNHFALSKRTVKELTLEDAVKTAKKFAEPGDIVLFTPACKSFDMFMNYEHRGEVYKDIVHSL